MSLTVSPVGENTRVKRTKRLAQLWKVTRTDGVPFHFTTHSRTLDFDSNDELYGNADINTYTPVGGFDASAVRRELGLSPNNLEFRGLINSAAITAEDLLAGLYRDAVIQEWLVDPKFPFLGPIISHKFWVQEVQQDGLFWLATVAGVSHKAQQKVGGVFSSLCPFEVFATGRTGQGGVLRNCGKPKDGYTRTGCRVQNIIADRLEFFVNETTLATASGVLGVPDAEDDFFTFGKLIWTKGLNIGTVSEVRGYVHGPGPREVSLRLKTPFPISSTLNGGDEFTIEAGCDKKKQTCIDKFNWLIGTTPGHGFGGFSFLTGPQAPVRGPFASAT